MALLTRFLPGGPTEDYWYKDKVMDWLGKQLAEKSFNEIVLHLLDKLMKEDYAHGGLHPGIIDDRVMRWFNRVYDTDLDSWLEAKTPVAFKFRREQLAKGYDPITIVSGYVYRAMSDGQLQEALDVIYPSAEDRKGCQELLEVVNDNLSPLHPQPTAGWEQRLKDWYWSQRSSLRYDSVLLRFVPQTGQTTSRPTSMSISQ